MLPLTTFPRMRFESRGLLMTMSNRNWMRFLCSGEQLVERAPDFEEEEVWSNEISLNLNHH